MISLAAIESVLFRPRFTYDEVGEKDVAVGNGDELTLYVGSGVAAAEGAGVRAGAASITG